MVLSSVLKWCWSRLPGGVVTWEAYELFRIGEQDSDMARDAFATFVPISVESDARTKIVFDFFDLMAAIAAHGKTNGMSGRKLSRLAGWWAFEHLDTSNGFDGGYKSWTSAADATSHLFFAYLRSLSPDSVRGVNGISALPLSLQNLVQTTEYPPAQPPLNTTSKVVMIVDSVSPTPFALLRRAKHFEYREDDEALQQFSDYNDPVQALTDECRRVLKSISSINQSTVSTSKASTSLPDASWSRFEDIGFGGFGEYSDNEDDAEDSAFGKKRRPQGMRSAPQSKNDYGRPTTPSWADFLSSGFVDEPSSPGPPLLSLPPDKVLPPIDTKRGHSSQSHRAGQVKEDLEPGELASINGIYLEDAFWWVWISSLAGEEPTERKAVFGRCALIETNIRGGTWLVIEEMVKGAAPEPEVGAYIAEKKSRFGFSKKGRLNRTMTKKAPPPKIEPYPRSTQDSPMSKTSIGPDQHARIQAAAAALKQKDEDNDITPRRARNGDAMSSKTNSVFTLQPVIMNEAASALKWANSYDKNSIRAAYLGNNFTGKGTPTDSGSKNLVSGNGSLTPVPPKDLPRSESYNFPEQNALPRKETNLVQENERGLPALPPETPKEQSTLENSRQASVEAPPLPENQPPPLPAATNEHPSERAVDEASEVPLPKEYPRPMETAEPQEHQLTSTLSRESQVNGAAGPSPESKRSKKLQKNNRRGIKSLFAKKPLPPSPQQPVDSAAVAAARAAYPGPQMKANFTNSQTTLSRRFSAIGRKKSPAPPMPSPAPPPIKDELESAMMQYDPPQHYEEPAPQNYESQASLSRVDMNEQRQPNQESNNFEQTEHAFNQGPMTDEPAFVPEDSPERATTPVEGSRPSYDVSSVSEDSRPPSPAKDRWAQIRKNAAERAARHSEEQSRKLSEEHSRVSHRDTDDGESDAGPEETIESRVARIKARVAELTGNMEANRA